MMMKRLARLLIVLLATSLLASTILAAEPELQWEKTFGGSERDYGWSVQQTSDGGYIIVGYTESYGSGHEDVYLIKTDSAGDSQWEKTFGGSDPDVGYSVQQTSDGGYIIAGYTESYGAGNEDVYLIKTNSTGDSQWEKTLGGSDGDYGRSVQQTSDGGYIIAGQTASYGSGSSDVYLVKTDSTGNSQWERTFGGVYLDYGFSVQQTSDGGYIIAGLTLLSLDQGSGEDDAYLIKTDSMGNSQWEKTFGGLYLEYGVSVQQTSDGGYIIAGYTESYGSGNEDVYLIKTNSTGDSQWEKTLGGSDGDYGRSVQQTSDGGYIIAGQTASYGSGSSDVYLVKTDGAGNSQWEKALGGSNTDYAESVQQTSDGGYIIAGGTWSYGYGLPNVYLIKLGEKVPEFGPNSVDFSDVPFSDAEPNDSRTYYGQGAYLGSSYSQTYSEDVLLGVNCLRVDETAVPEHGKESVTFWMGKDVDGSIWLFKAVLDGVEIFEAESLADVLPCDQAPLPMRFRLMTGNWDVGTVVTDLTGNTTEVLSATETLPQFSGRYFVKVKWTSSDGNDVDYAYHHESVGLVMDIWDDSGITSGDAWLLEGFTAGGGLHDWNADGIVSFVGDVPPFVDCVYFQDCPGGVDPIAVGDCNDDGILSIVGDVPCFVDCVYFGNCLE